MKTNHNYLDSAIRAAKKLSKLNPGQRYYIHSREYDFLISLEIPSREHDYSVVVNGFESFSADIYENKRYER